MSGQFQPGDIVECINDRPAAPAGPDSYYVSPFPVRGQLYVAGDVYTDPRGDDRVIIDGAPNNCTHGQDWGWGVYRFRKVYRPDPKLIERLTAEPIFAPPVKQPGKVKA